MLQDNTSTTVWDVAPQKWTEMTEMVNQYGIPRPGCVGMLGNCWNSRHIRKKKIIKLHDSFYLLI